MNRRLPYEEELLRKTDDLPLPGEDAAWQKMQDLLDKKDDRKPAAFWRWGAVMVLLIVLGGLAIREIAKKDKENKSATEHQQATAITSGIVKAGEKITPKHLKRLQDESAKPPGQSATIDNVVPSSRKNENGSVGENEIISQTTKRDASVSSRKTKDSLDIFINNKKSSAIRETDRSEEAGNQKAGMESARNLLPGQANKVGVNLPASSNAGLTPNNKPANATPDVIPGEKQLRSTPADSLNTTQTKTLISDKKQPGLAEAVDSIAPRVAIKAKPKLFSAGISIQQPIQFAGQKAVAYGYKAGTLVSDYIPSLWFRYERPNRYFLQGEFIYSAPQLVREFSFSRQTKPDTGRSSTTTTLHMKKTFFNQVPISFNYFVRPNWSVGAGLGYAWLQGAITQREIVNNGSQGQTLIKREILPVNGFTDSFLYRSHSLVLLQTEYKWNRLSAGIKYTRDLQSFITYTAPDGRIIDKKNSALSLVLRFRIWQK